MSKGNTKVSKKLLTTIIAIIVVLLGGGGYYTTTQLPDKETTATTEEKNKNDDNDNTTNNNETTDNDDETTDTNTIDYKFRTQDQLDSHYEKHGIEMGFKSAEEYEAAASAVANNPKALHKTEAEDGDDIYYIEETNEFVVVSTDGYIRTYYYPSAGKDYFDRQ